MSSKSGPIRNRLRAPDQRPGASVEQYADASGNRAQRRAWAKLTKSKTPLASDSNTDTDTEAQ